LLNAGNDVQRWWRLVYTVLTGMVELLHACRHLWTMDLDRSLLLLVTSASDLLIRIIKFCSVVSAYSSMPVINKIH